MNTVSYKKIAQFSAAMLSSFTLVMSPVAQGAEAQRFSKKQVDEAIKETGLNKRITYKEFWEKSKHVYHGQVYKDMERYFMQSPSKIMPAYSVKESLNSQGEKTAVITFSEGGKQYSMQLIGEKNEYIKINNVVLTENDVLLVTPAMRRLAASDIKIKKDLDKSIVVAPHYSGTPKITKESWKKMTPMQRAQFMVNMRLLWSGAQAVLDSKPSTVKKSGGKKTSSLDFNVLDKWNMFIALLGNEADANSGKCVVAGYIGTYGKSTRGGYSCQYPKENVAAAGCSYPCNPTIYGYGSDGKTLCVADHRSLQTATHWNGACDKQMPMSSNQLSLPSVASKAFNSGRYDGVVLTNFAEAAKDPKNIELTKKYLDSILNSESPELKSAFAKGEMSEDLLKKLLEIQTNFDNTIKAARDECAVAADDKSHYDKEFWGACDQLHRRFLFVAAYLAEQPGCKKAGEGSKINPSTLKCSCADGGETVPGAACDVAPVVETPVQEAAGLEACYRDYPGVEGITYKDGECLCSNGKKPTKKSNTKSEEKETPVIPDVFYKPKMFLQAGMTVAHADVAAPASEYECKGFNWKPLLIVGGFIAGFFLLKHLMFDKNKKSHANGGQVCSPPKSMVGGSCQCAIVCAANTSLNPTTCSCDPIIVEPSCAAPKVLTGGACVCPTTNACTPGQQVYNMSTCQCDTVAQPITCPDGVTVVTNANQCPAPTLCWDGSQVYGSTPCPERNEGGSGNNCPDGGCNGGVPTAN